MNSTGLIFKRSLLAILTGLLTYVASAQVTTASVSGYTALQFIENKGQWNDQVRYMTDMYNGALYLLPNGFKVLQHSADDLNQLHLKSHRKTGIKTDSKVEPPLQSFTLHSHAYEMNFVGGSDRAQVVPDKIQSYYNNYFIGNDPARWASSCKIYKAVEYRDVYPGINVRYYSQEGLLKYDLILSKDANPSNIVMRYSGVEGLEVKNKKLVIKTSVGDVNELEPYAYQFINGIKKTVNCSFEVKNNTVQFKIGDYDRSETLIIDPTLVFCSFTGSTSDNWGMTATYGPDGSLYAGGIVQANGFPTTNGAIQTTYQGGEFVNLPGDMAILRFQPDGSNIIYGTYIGGSRNEQPHSLVVDGAGNLIIAGRSNSSNYPVVAAPGQNLGARAGYDIVVTKLNATGTSIIGSIKIGGSANDGVNIDANGRESGRNSLMQNYGDDGRSEVIIDFQNRVWLASSSHSADFPVVNAFQPVKRQGQDAIVMRLNFDCNAVQMASYLGGDADDAGFILAAQPITNRIYVAGGTASTNFPGLRAGVVQPAYAGGIADGYITILSADTIVASTYVGTSGTDIVFGVQFDKNGFPYVMGTSTGAMPITNAAYGQAGGKQFIWKLEKDLSAAIYQTAYGPASSPTPNISPTAFLVDRCENVYVSGWGAIGIEGYPMPGVVGLPVSPDAGGQYLKNNPGSDGSDFHFVVIKRNASALLFGCYFGQNGGDFPDHVDGGTSRFDPQGNIYQGICANCGGPTNIFPTFPPGGVYAPINGTGNNNPIRCNEAVVKIHFDYSGVGAGVQSAINSVKYDTLACIPVRVVFRDTIRNAIYYIWDYGDGTPRDTVFSPVDSIDHTYTTAGLYTVMLIAVDENSCNLRDTSFIRIKAGTNKAVLDFSFLKLPPCENLTYAFRNLSRSVLSRPFFPRAFEWDFGDNSPKVIASLDSIVNHTFPAPGSYKIRLRLLDTSFCNFQDFLDTTLRIATTIRADFDNSPLCLSERGDTIRNLSTGGVLFNWTVQGDPATYTTFNLNYVFPRAGDYSVTLQAVDSNSCNKVSTITKIVQVRDKPKALFTYSPNTVPAPDNTPTTFTNLSYNGAIRYLWDFRDGDTSNEVNPVHQYQATGTFRPLLTAYNQFGCSDTFSLPVTVLIVPYLDVPNAFRPGSAVGENRQVKVYGFGISKIKWRIFNRWGQLIFEGLTRDAAWDGRYKGQLQPMDVYTYTLEVEYFDGKKVKKSGNITLLR